MLIAVGLSVCYLSNNWNIGAEGQFIVGAVAGAGSPVVFHGTDVRSFVLPADAAARRARRRALCR